ncbi:MAG: hypothetical protein WA193_15325, partial [Candidatus Acidiferrales bacterium]
MRVMLLVAMTVPPLGAIKALVMLSHWLTKGKRGLDGGGKLQKLRGLLGCVFLVSGWACEGDHSLREV